MRKVARKKDAEAKRTGLAARKVPAKKSGGKTEATPRKKRFREDGPSSRRRTRQVSVAAKKADGKSSVASKKHEDRKPARVRQSFAGAKSEQKSRRQSPEGLS